MSGDTAVTSAVGEQDFVVEWVELQPAVDAVRSGRKQAR